MNKQTIKIWHSTISNLASNIKIPSSLGTRHLAGYLKRCAQLEYLEPDPYINQFIRAINYLLKRAPESEHLKLLALRDALSDLLPYS